MSVRATTAGTITRMYQMKVAMMCLNLYSYAGPLGHVSALPALLILSYAGGGVGGRKRSSFHIGRTISSAISRGKRYRCVQLTTEAGGAVYMVAEGASESSCVAVDYGYSTTI